MTLISLAALAEIVGGFAVLATLIYLIFELRENTKALKTKVRTASYLGWADFNVMLSKHPERGVIARAFDPQESLKNFSKTEQVTISSLGRAMMQRFSAAFFQYNSSVLTRDDWLTQATYCNSIFSLPVWNSWWSAENKLPIYSDEFISSINSTGKMDLFVTDNQIENSK